MIKNLLRVLIIIVISVGVWFAVKHGMIYYLTDECDKCGEKILETGYIVEDKTYCENCKPDGDYK